MAFSVSHIFAHNSGMQLISFFGYEITWYIMVALLLIAVLFLIWLKHIVKNESLLHPQMKKKGRFAVGRKLYGLIGLPIHNAQTYFPHTLHTKATGIAVSGFKSFS